MKFTQYRKNLEYVSIGNKTIHQCVHSAATRLIAEESRNYLQRVSVKGGKDVGVREKEGEKDRR